ncbi:cobaltochelatase subunit CobN [Streptomyces sp. NRRL F-5053]|uniref:cobaltochelatase subunit CobN n=1 Tax=Streptomyces sp. NRRL F-5053 TaxID=1463854 RepID=UPI0013317A5B|nr:cobaltochelatase subunit CobN [Streptomyces sp. NRRL F-5053]
MAVSYEDILNANLKSLKKAAQAWRDMGDRFGTLHDAYRSNVKPAVDSDSWRGDSSNAYKAWSKVTLGQYVDAQKEAKGVAELLDFAYSVLKSHKEDVKKKRDKAKDEGMVVDSHGRCTMLLVNVAAIKGQDTADYYREHPEKRQAEETKWTDAVARAVKSTQKADEYVAYLLTHTPKGKSGVPNGFNGAIKGYAGKVGAARVSKTYEAIKNGKNPSLRHCEKQPSSPRRTPKTLCSPALSSTISAARTGLSRSTTA